MTTITIPQKLAKQGDLVLVPKGEYEELLQRAQAFPVVRMTAKDRRDSARADREIKAGKFSSWKQVKHELDRLHHVKS